MNEPITENHSRTIIHIDIDCFYAQVEMIKNPALVNIPFGVQQKNLVVTSNYIAREYGIQKCASVEEAQKLCPNIVLVNGEDLRDYRQMSYKITNYLQQYTPLVERLGLDENFIDVTDLVADRLQKRCKESGIVGNVYGDMPSNCLCGCEERLSIGTQIAQDIRNSIKQEFKLTCSAGIAHNKLLAKIAGSINKPDKQTLVFPSCALELVANLKSFRNIPGIGNATANILKCININTIEDLQNCNIQTLNNAVGPLKAKFLCDVRYGIDLSPVKPSGRPLSIGLEDSCKSISVESEVKEKLLVLLQRLALLVKEDGRTPRTIKLTVRKFDKETKTSIRETRQCNVAPYLFTFKNNESQLAPASQSKLITIIINLFKKMVNTNKPYHITLLGLSCTKFQDAVQIKCSLTSFLRKNVEVQSLTSIESTNTSLDGTMDFESKANITNEWDSETEPSSKKLKVISLISKGGNISKDFESPSKLRVADLRLGPHEPKFTTNANQNILCPPNIDKDVFKELPAHVQKELWDDYKRDYDRCQSSRNSHTKRAKTRTLLDYFIKN